MNWTPEGLEALGKRLINGHPTMELDPGDQEAELHWRPWGISRRTPKSKPITIYLCANCERVRSVMFLTEDRWLCTSCKNEGDARPAFFPITKPER